MNIEPKHNKLNYKWIADLYLSGKCEKDIVQVTGYVQSSVCVALKKIKRELKNMDGDNFTDLLQTSVVDSIRVNKTINSELMTEFIRLQIALDKLSSKQADESQTEAMTDKERKASERERTRLINDMIKLSAAISTNYKNLFQPIMKMGVSPTTERPKGSQYPDSSGSLESGDLAYLKGFVKRQEGKDDKTLVD